MVVLLHAAAFALLFAAVYYLPGRLLVDLLPGRVRRFEALPLSLGLGLVAVDTAAILLTGLTDLAAGWLMSPVQVLLAAAAVAAAAWLVRRRRPADRAPWWRRPSRAQVGLWALTALATGFFLLLYDGDLFEEDTCKVLAATLVNADYRTPELLQLVVGDAGLAAFEDEPDLQEGTGRVPFLLQHYGQRLGPSVLLSPLLALYGTFGFRLLYVLQGLLLPGLGYLLGRRVLGRGWPAWTTAVLLTFSPYATRLQTFDENILACCFGSLALALLVRRPTAPALAGGALGLFLGLRHIGVLLLPAALLYLARRSPDRARDALRFAVATAVLSIPYLILHASMLITDGILFESAADPLPVPHSLFGMQFELPVFLNFPLLPEPMRSPYNAYAPLVAYPLDLLHRFGWLAAALVPAGLARLFVRDRATAWLLVTWFGGILAVLLVQSSWTEPNKMGIPATVLAPAVLTVVSGAGAVVRARSHLLRLGWLALGLAMPLVALQAARSWEMPLDNRMFECQPDPEDELDYAQHASLPRGLLRSDESAPYIAWERQQVRPRPWPRLGHRQVHPALVRLRLVQLADHLRHPTVRAYERPMLNALNAAMLGPGMQLNPISLMKVQRLGPSEAGGLHPVALFQPGDPEAHRDLQLDLAEPPSLSDEPLLPLQGADDAVHDLERGHAVLVEDLPVSFDHRRENLFAARDRHGTVFLALFPGEVGTTGSPPWLPLERSVGGTRAVALRLPVGAVIRIFDVRNYMPDTPAPGHPRVYVRTAVVGEDRIWLSHATPTSVF